jgi:hypothetical protein
MQVLRFESSAVLIRSTMWMHFENHFADGRMVMRRDILELKYMAIVLSML